MTKDDGENKGGGQRGGPRRWTGTGPRPARHIPWPELFKHHTSVLQGHLKMMDMVRKHCPEGSGNYIMAKACVDRTHEMMRMFRKATATFVPPRDNIDRVPLGASSASMYPGYSPADHIYGEAAAEYGQQVSEAKKHGIEVPKNPLGVEYTLAADQQGAKEQYEEIKRKREEEQKRRQEDNSQHQHSQDPGSEPMEGVEQTTTGEDLFIIDANPTPIEQLQSNSTMSTPAKTKNKANDKAKRRVSFQDEQASGFTDVISKDTHKKKKLKLQADASKDDGTSAEVPLRAKESSQPASQDDFEQEVEARHKEREERRNTKKEKKRKRESGSIQQGDNAVKEELVQPLKVEASSEEPQKKKQKKKKHKDTSAEVKPDSDQIASSDLQQVTTEVKPDEKISIVEKSKKKKKRASQDSVAEIMTPADEEKSKKKQRKEKAVDSF